MKKGIQKFSSLVLALLVLVSTFSFTIDKHFCGGDLVAFSVFEHTDACGMAIQNPSSTDDCSTLSTNCCIDSQLVLDGQDDLKTAFQNSNASKQIFAASFIYTYLNLFEGLQENVIPFRNYSPPVLVLDIQLLDQTFLI
ncbi:HYC_CC_PP family protein [Gillisia sp. Hel_I_86]|uniref:HYC_CC_PP family protein n=1 Tax=Gillisia sp. Hel_I_86 TaxID=1249981 RepID=UPI00119ED10F|nr:hypothetical protein [Gillisia sp. Hel_I_86]